VVAAMAHPTLEVWPAFILTSFSLPQSQLWWAIVGGRSSLFLPLAWLSGFTRAIVD
jgi:hypothetical protein